MNTYICVIDCKLYDFNNIKTLLILPSNNPLDLKNNLQEAVVKKLVIKHIYKILNYSAYDVSKFLKTVNKYEYKLKTLSINIINYHSKNGGRGQEHYICNESDLLALFNLLEIKYKIINDMSIFEGEKSHINNNGDASMIEKLINQI